MTEKEKSIKRVESERLIRCYTLVDCLDFLNIYCEYLCCVVQYDTIKGEKYICLHEANLVNQMIFSKTLSLKKFLEGIYYTSKVGIQFKGLIDPTVIAILVRNIFETVFMFNLVYIQPKSEEERLILYNLWVYSGLSYRQMFDKHATKEEYKVKMKKEKEHMQNIKEEIERTFFYNSLSEKDKKFIQEQLLKRKEYKIAFYNGKIKKLTWRDVCLNAGLKPDLFEDTYNFFSLYAHPSNVSVFQFQDLFKNLTFLELTMHILLNAFHFLSVFVADYIKLFADRIQVFESLPVEWQIAIDFKNRLARSDEFSINNCWDKLK